MLWQWIAWNKDRERICDCGVARAESETVARGVAWQCIGGPHMESITEIQVKKIEGVSL